ncbi:TPA: RNA-directed DNA polymerase [Escherichia coli]|uniref:antiviral reverse transcriptase Drt3b n=1 Tax=Enterobacteriaceae TaxID=543 RepID=UPI0017A99D27|nr:antiviral reverse transcriptase Drt3b [Escherichia coli]MCM7200467.1 RNA-directed DNA polymerase [Enterobacter hormaechei]HBZ5600648.1 RNA-directed DNA polymerase [Morganella morganii]EFC1755820.1 RNA-directed DNA polymerase [Escherichia coli]EFH4636029.1 ABC transporter ATP-binding protein [Escherichia coli]EFH6993432.1 ABC transporter ATP-binding protein [Escherichia coli]
MSKKALSINFPIERVVLSDFLPYEVPIIFSNRHFYNFIVKHQIKHDGLNFIWLKRDCCLNSLILLLLGLEQNTATVEIVDNGISYIITDIEHAKLPSIAFTFPISHKHKEYRYLSLMHPKGQLLGVDFYRNYKDLITYYSNVSPFSLRSAKRVAGCTYIDSKSLIESFDKEDLSIEVEGQDYENLKSFFVYKKYRNIFEFYESEDHHWCEKRFNFLSKLDVSNCFDSIYTHSISWAVLQKSYAKQHLNKTKSTFPFKFDQLMQRSNYNETNGIIIGPELSRIFAEIIMQSVDNNIINDLNKDGLVLGEDYQVYRYVDDYFIFYNDEDVFNKIRISTQTNLKTYKLSLNKYKEERFSRPIITPITIAKKKIANLISERISYNITDNDSLDEDSKKGNVYIHQNSLSTDFKSILSVSGITYSDILNYSLSIIERKIKTLFKDYKELSKDGSGDRQLINAIVSVVNFTYFIYAVAPKVNSTIKLCRIIQQIIMFVKDQKLGEEYQHIVFKCVFDNSCSILDKYSVDKTTPIETLYLLVLIRQLGKYYWLGEKSLMKYFNISFDGGVYSFDDNLNYFSITSLMFYMSDKKRYDGVRAHLLLHIDNIYSMKVDTLLNESELVHLTLDLIACPYISVSFKKALLSRYGIDESYVKRIVSLNEYWFTKWNDFDFAKELDAKLSNAVY